MFAMVLISSSSHPASVFVCVHVGELVCACVCRAAAVPEATQV